VVIIFDRWICVMRMGRTVGVGVQNYGYEFLRVISNLSRIDIYFMCVLYSI
jgi:hypothetical protein